MITMMTTKDDEQKAQMNQRTSQENQDQDQDSRIKNSRLKKKVYKQVSIFKISRIKDQDSRIKNQDSRSQESRSRFKNEEKTQSR